MCDLALVTRAHDFLTSTDSAVFLRGARAFTLQHPPVQQVEDVTRIEDLPDLSDADLGRMRAIRDEARQKNGVTPPVMTCPTQLADALGDLLPGRVFDSSHRGIEGPFVRPLTLILR